MSHAATNWAFQQRGLKPAAWRVLAVLADCHNPARGCFPTQAFLADACEINRDTVNAQLNLLEERGLIRRIRCVDPQTRRQRPTRYKLAFEADFDSPDSHEESLPGARDKTMSENPTWKEAVSEIPAEPCRKNGESRVGKPDTNPVREPVREPVNDDDDRAGEPDDFRGKILEAVGLDPDERTALGGPVEMAEARRWLDLPHVSEDLVCEQIRVVMARKGGEPPHSLGYFTPEMQRLSAELDAARTPLAPASRRPEKARPGVAGPMAPRPALVDLDGLAALWAPKVTAGAYVPSSAISAALARHMLDRGLVSQAELRRVGVAP